MNKPNTRKPGIRKPGIQTKHSKHKDSADDLVSQESTFRSLAENIPYNVMRHDLEGRIVYVNSLLEKTLNISSHELMGKVVFDEFPVSLYPSFAPYQDAIREILREERAIDVEITLPLPQGGAELHAISLVPEHDANGKLYGVLAVGRDITERKKIENELRQRELEFRSLAENSLDSIVRYDLNCKATYCNVRLERTTPYEACAILGKTPTELAVDGFDPLIDLEQKIKEVLVSGVPDQIELWGPNAYGESRLFQVNISAEMDTEQQIIGVLAIGRDITNRKKMEDALQKKEREFRNLADNFPYLIVRYDILLQPIYTNKAYQGLTKSEFYEVIQKSNENFWSIEDNRPSQDLTSHLTKVIATKLPEDFFVKYQGDNGIVNLCEILLIPEFDDLGNIASVLCIGHNSKTYEKAMLELRELNSKLHQLSAQRETAREEERKHIAQEVHDQLGQLLSVLHLHASTLDYLYGSDNQALRERCNTMMQVANQAIYTVKNLVTHVRPMMIEHGFNFALECLFEDFSKNTGISFQLNLIEEFRPDDSSSIILFRIFQEALTNIMRHSQADLVSVNITSAQEQVLIEIVDNGCGFKLDLMSRPNAFGIISMQERALALGGKLAIQSQQSHGTSIKISMPIHHTAEPIIE